MTNSYIYKIYLIFDCYIVINMRRLSWQYKKYLMPINFFYRVLLILKFIYVYLTLCRLQTQIAESSFGKIILYLKPRRE